VVTDFTFDGLGRLTKHTLKGVTGDPAALTTSYSYTAAGLLSQVTSPIGNSIKLAYDSSDRLITADRLDTGGLAHDRYQIDYDAMSQPSDELARACATPAGNCSTWNTTQQENFKFDSYGRLSEVDHPIPAGAKIVVGYDAAGNLTTVQDENHTTANATYGYDLANRLISLTQTLAGAPGGQILTQYGYGVLDDLASITDPNSNQTTYAFDDFGRVRTQNSPVSGLSSYAYDPADNLTNFSDANGATTTSTFDALDRILTATSVRSGSTTESVSWTYDDATSGHFGIGRVASMSDPTGSTTYTYERRGLLKSEARTVLGTLYNLAYGYDHNGNRNSLTYPDASVVAYAFDWADRPISATSGTKHFVTAAGYEPFGPLASLTFGNGSNQTFSYDQRYRPVENKLINGATTLADYLYQEDPVGNITQIHDNTNAAYNRDFSYDDLNRLTTANSGASLWGTQTGNGYTYDLMGNIKTLQLGSGRIASFAYSGTLPKLTSVTENGTPRSVGYDAAGNETAVGSASYTYRPRNLLASGDSLSYVYDGWGRRAVSTTSSGSRYSFYSPDMTLLSETNVSNAAPTVAYDYIYFGGRPIAQSDATGVHYTVADHLGTPLLQTDSSANVYWRAEHEPYGKVWSLRAGDVHQPLRLPGQVAEQFDTGPNGLTERSYNNYRWYRPGWGRYTQVDPLAGGFATLAFVDESLARLSDSVGSGLNLLVYAADNPLDEVDALGLNVGDPGFWESLIPIWGSGRQAINDFQCGRWRWGVFNGVLALSDVTLVKSTGEALIKGGWKFGSNSWPATRRWLNGPNSAWKNIPGYDWHHWFLQQNQGVGKHLPDWLKNQPWNLMSVPRDLHNAIHEMGPFGRFWNGSPLWFKAGILSPIGRYEMFLDRGLTGNGTCGC
jgi:RHS repeat-associated protein